MNFRLVPVKEFVLPFQCILHVKCKSQVEKSRTQNTDQSANDSTSRQHTYKTTMSTTLVMILKNEMGGGVVALPRALSLRAHAMCFL